MDEYLMVSNIQRFSVDDGPGIRTTVFLQGCNLQCSWCHNPENISLRPVLQFKASACISCGRCVQVCPQHVHRMDGKCHSVERSRCKACGKCVEACFAQALAVKGKQMEPETVFSEIVKDEAYYRTSGGGVTFSGGEPLLQWKALKEILRMCKKEKLHTAVDTAGSVPFKYFEEVLPYTDLFLYDIKCISKDIHIKYTGTDNAQILSNIHSLAETDKEIIIRTPFIEGVNAEKEEIRKIREFIDSLPRKVKYEPLLYHEYGLPKYGLLGLDEEPHRFQTPHPETFLSDDSL